MAGRPHKLIVIKPIHAPQIIPLYTTIVIDAGKLRDFNKCIDVQLRQLERKHKSKP